jgi:hypothetical protein
MSTEYVTVYCKNGLESNVYDRATFMKDLEASRVDVCATDYVNFRNYYLPNNKIFHSKGAGTLDFSAFSVFNFVKRVTVGDTDLGDLYCYVNDATMSMPGLVLALQFDVQSAFGALPKLRPFLTFNNDHLDSCTQLFQFTYWFLPKKVCFIIVLSDAGDIILCDTNASYKLTGLTIDNTLREFFEFIGCDFAAIIYTHADTEEEFHVDFSTYEEPAELDMKMSHVECGYLDAYPIEFLDAQK